MSNARMRSVTNYFIINLSMADIINATFNVIPNFTYMLTGNWPFGETSIIFFTILNNISPVLLMGLCRWAMLALP